MRAKAWMAMMMMLLLHEYHAAAEFFDFSSFSSDEISWKNDATITERGVIALTRSSGETVRQPGVGRVFYKRPIPLWTNATTPATLASFNSSFNFRIRYGFGNFFGGNGNGMAFLMSGEISEGPLSTVAYSLGFLNGYPDADPMNEVVAIEFDTKRDVDNGDLDDNHVGIDVNSYRSNASRSLNDSSIILGDGRNLSAWVDYDGNSRFLSVYVALSPLLKPGSPVISRVIDLSQYLPETMYIGFSAETYFYIEIHEIFTWQFSSTSLLNPAAPAPIIARTPTIAPTRAPVSTDGPSSSMLSVSAIVGIALALLFLVALMPAIFLFIRRKGNNNTEMKKREWKLDEAELAECAGPRRFTYREIISATKNFSEENYLGHGGFGPVYKGILSNVGTPVAIKSIGQNSKQGEKEFMAEVTIISRIRHRNLVPLQGWCHEKGQLFLVYDYMPNGSLDQHLFNAVNPLEWRERHKIVCGLAAGLQYLHQGWEKQVIHRDIKSANVLLDEDFNAHLGDFGMARFVEHNQMPQTTMAAGTLGYLAPEVVETGKATSTSDVYSFGAVALEVACGRNVLDYSAPYPSQVRLVEWVWELNSKGLLHEAVDPGLEGNFVNEEMERILLLALACSHPNPQSRPNMRQVHECLLNYDIPNPPISLSKPLVCSKSFFQGRDRPPHIISITTVLSDTSTSISNDNNNNSTSARFSSTTSSSSSSSSSSTSAIPPVR